MIKYLYSGLDSDFPILTVTQIICNSEVKATYLENIEKGQFVYKGEQNTKSYFEAAKGSKISISKSHHCNIITIEHEPWNTGYIIPLVINNTEAKNIECISTINFGVGDSFYRSVIDRLQRNNIAYELHKQEDTIENYQK